MEGQFGEMQAALGELQAALAEKDEQIQAFEQDLSSANEHTSVRRGGPAGGQGQQGRPAGRPGPRGAPSHEAARPDPHVRFPTLPPP